MALKLAQRMDRQKASVVREILKVAQQPDVISFAGGLPAPEFFPVDDIEKAISATLQKRGREALQYTTTEGYKPLRQWIADRMNRTVGTNFDADNILITHGSQQGLDLTGKLFIDEGDTVFCESPTYLAAISAFRAYGANFVAVDSDEEGMKPEDLERKLKEAKNPKFIYVIPSFQNPSSRTWTEERRKQLYELAEKYNVAVLEDNPYGELYYESSLMPAVATYDKTGRVIVLGSFSKIFCPGFRIAWIAADKELIRKYVLLKQSTDLQCNTLAQLAVYEYVTTFDIDKHVENLRKVYKHRRDLALDVIKRTFPAEAKVTTPQGGLFLWVELPGHIDTAEMLKESLKHKVAFVPGETFFTEPGHTNCLRINFSNMPEDRIVSGLETLGALITEYLKKN